jgi:predicted urease superfamily metal-dependent hydrolase
MELALIAALAGLGVIGYKHYNVSAKLTAIKAEIANIEAHVKADYSLVSVELTAAEQKAKAALLNVIAAIKAKL